MSLLLLMDVAGCANEHRATITQQPPVEGQALPIHFVNNLPIVRASIAGEPVYLIVDIGGHDALALKQESVDGLTGVFRTSHRQLSFNAAGDLALDREIVAPELGLGEVIVKDVHGRIIDIPLPPQALERVDGYIGAALLTHFRLLVDYPAQIVLYPTGASAALNISGWRPVRIDAANRCRRATLNQREISAGWDTGASHSVIDDDLAQRMFGVSTGSVRGRLTLDDQFSYWLEMHVIELRGAGVDVLIGHNCFAEHRVLFDFPAGIAYVEPPKSPAGANSEAVGGGFVSK